MFCPRCGAEYREGFTRCADCDVDLLVERPEPQTLATAERIVVLRTYASEFEARVAMTALDAVGIAATVRVDDASGLNPALAFSRGAELLVRAEDLAAAEDTLAADG
jgi:hypothetical protein